MPPLDNLSAQLFQRHFSGQPSHSAFAPGRIEFIGNHTDYNGGLVMGAAVTEGITIAVSLRDDEQIQIVSDAGDLVELNLGNYQPLSGPDSWTNYPIGVTQVMTELGMRTPTGYNMAVTSTLPAGAGMSSSAAFELATAKALAALYGFETDTAGFARIGRKAENEFVGMPCGILDQGVSAFGQADHLVKIDCATESFATEPMPEGAHFWIFNSNKKHALVDSAYADRHRECHEALAQLQVDYPDAQNLSQITEAQLESSKPKIDELLYRRAAHVVGENARVQAVQAALAQNDLKAVGSALNASHESSRVNFNNSIEELDTLVDLLKQQPNVYGARLTGGGFGGAVMALTDADFGQTHADLIATAFEAKHQLQPSIFHTRAGDGAQLL
ncbi:galactokinase [Coraliomargarita sp. SDUM461003]|uniref:Galactokinase n=1 Tax=Thalassobacterium maritimum TaxID=3041265 RepID=A0ABU1ATU6_9BACT|nr:galactokinase [Coraliomargarita sp. SDUM461003]MDQ8207580.1 galactokinase [Coraliomargarita sp. SDUM461003]